MLGEAEYLVVGGDSLVGQQVYREFQDQGINVLSTTRRQNEISDTKILLDFEEPDTWNIPKGIKVALVIAAATNYEFCATNPKARLINVDYITAFIRSLLERDVFVVYISTNSVFGGEQAWPKADAEHQPDIPYAQQKSESEEKVVGYAETLNKTHLLNITRLTKILDISTPPIPTWLNMWKENKVVEPFSDLIFAPMSKEFVAKGLVEIARKRLISMHHLSGAENVSYVDFAREIMAQKNISTSLLNATTSEEKGVHIAFKPRFSGLDMTETSKEIGVPAQSLDSVVRDVFQDKEI